MEKELIKEICTEQADTPDEITDKQLEDVSGGGVAAGCPYFKLKMKCRGCSNEFTTIIPAPAPSLNRFKCERCGNRWNVKREDLSSIAEFC